MRPNRFLSITAALTQAIALSAGMFSLDTSAAGVDDYSFDDTRKAIPLSQEKSFNGVVMGVHDGDTITVLDHAKRSYKVRLDGIDAPELSQAFGRTSKHALSDLVYRKPVVVVYRSVDRYDRRLGSVKVHGVNVNEAQVATGMAWVYRAYDKRSASHEPLASGKPYLKVEEVARVSKVGLWSDGKAIAPWDYRRKMRDPKLADPEARAADLKDDPVMRSIQEDVTSTFNGQKRGF